MSNEIGIGILGSGFMGRTYSECLTRYVQGARVSAVSGGSRAPQLALDYQVAYEPSTEALLDRDDIRAVIITTPEMVHRKQTELAAGAGKHVLVEKPMAPSIADCQAMIVACAQARVTLMVVQSQRFRGVHQRAKGILADRTLGSVWQLRHWASQPLEHAKKLVAKSPFYLDPAGGGLYMGFSVHNFDLVRWLVGADVSTVYAQVKRYGDHHIPNLSLMAQLGFDNGVMAQIWVNLEMPGETFNRSTFRTQIVGEKGLLDFDGYNHLDLKSGDGWQRIWEQPAFDLSNPQDPVRLEAYIDMVQEFVDAIHEKRQPAVSGDDGRVAVELSLAALQSSQTDQVIELPQSI
jgi:predicted dehydrogenase